jgi:hypothetical protein
MNESQLEQVQDIRNAINDLYSKLKVDLYKKHTGVKVRYEKVDLTKLVEGNLEFIVGRLNQLRDGE